MTLPQSNKLTLLAAIALAFTLPFQTILADKTKAHPSTTAQVRLGSWWFARHAEKIAEIEEANDPKKDKKN